ncbi:hypothetical protein FA10DRAFT_268262 [Acaromyces ingoldii]|uniref:Uncharacterized protein n=1 Tax=Acaromyces ingoldii TaxID=215250 RepID=A0A316YEN9_9BASI|nr:hypothetical protein FA10DRAFT_268262 [Acaromyces ingoldii]PWN88040.1 hypothetical protein FA10DRAFT_268262 [Acaromyces ingoldii]
MSLSRPDSGRPRRALGQLSANDLSSASNHVNSVAAPVKLTRTTALPTPPPSQKDASASPNLLGQQPSSTPTKRSLRNGQGNKRVRDSPSSSVFHSPRGTRSTPNPRARKVADRSSRGSPVAMHRMLQEQEQPQEDEGEEEDSDEEDYDAHMTDEIILLPTSLSRSRLESSFNESFPLISTPVTKPRSPRGKQPTSSSALRMQQAREFSSFPLASTPIAAPSRSRAASKDKAPLLKTLHYSDGPSPLLPPGDDVFDVDFQHGEEFTEAIEPAASSNQPSAISSPAQSKQAISRGSKAKAAGTRTKATRKGKGKAKVSDDTDDDDGFVQKSSDYSTPSTPVKIPEIVPTPRSNRAASRSKSTPAAKASPASKRSKIKDPSRRSVSILGDEEQEIQGRCRSVGSRRTMSPPALSRLSEEVAPRPPSPSDDPMLLRGPSRNDVDDRHASASLTGGINGNQLGVSEDLEIKSEDEDEVFGTEHLLMHEGPSIDGEDGTYNQAPLSLTATSQRNDSHLKEQQGFGFEPNDFIDPRLLVKKGDDSPSREDKTREEESSLEEESDREESFSAAEMISREGSEDEQERARQSDNEDEDAEGGHGISSESVDAYSHIHQSPNGNAFSDQEEVNDVYTEALDEQQEESTNSERSASPMLVEMGYNAEWDMALRRSATALDHDLSEGEAREDDEEEGEERLLEHHRKTEEQEKADEQIVDQLIDMDQVEEVQTEHDFAKGKGDEERAWQAPMEATVEKQAQRITKAMPVDDAAHTKSKNEAVMQTEQETEEEKRVVDITISTDSSLPSPPRAQSMMIDADGEASFFGRRYRSSTAMDRSATDMPSHSVNMASPSFARTERRAPFVRHASVPAEDSTLDVSMQERSAMLSMRHNAVEIASFDKDAAARAVAVLTQFSDFVQYGSLDSLAGPSNADTTSKQIRDNVASGPTPLSCNTSSDTRFAIPSRPASSVRRAFDQSPATPFVPGGFPRTPNVAAATPSPSLGRGEEAVLYASKDVLLEKARRGHGRLLVDAGDWSKAAWASLDDIFTAEILAGANVVLKGGQKLRGQAQKEALKRIDGQAILDVFLEAHHIEPEDLIGEWSRRKLSNRVAALRRRQAIRVERRFPGTLNEEDRRELGIDLLGLGSYSESLPQTPSSQHTRARSESSVFRFEEEGVVPFVMESTPLPKNVGAEASSLYPKLPALGAPVQTSEPNTPSRERSASPSPSQMMETPRRERSLVGLASKGLGFLASKVATPLRFAIAKEAPTTSEDGKHVQREQDREGAQADAQAPMVMTPAPPPLHASADRSRRDSMVSTSSVSSMRSEPKPGPPLEMRAVERSPSVASLGAAIAELAAKRNQRASLERSRSMSFQKGDSSYEVETSFATRIDGSFAASSASLRRVNSFSSASSGDSSVVGAFGSSRRTGTSGQVVQTALSNLNDGISHSKAAAKVEEFRRSRSSRAWKSPRSARMATAKSGAAGDTSILSSSFSRINEGEASVVRDRKTFWEERAAKGV